MSKVIISCAVTGAVHTPTMSPHLPITPEEIAQQSVAAARAGASIIHLHARDPADGRPTPASDIYIQFLPEIARQTDAVINIPRGTEDSLYLGHGRLATSNAEQVGKIRTILAEIGLELASPDEARQMLQLRGRSNVAFT